MQKFILSPIFSSLLLTLLTSQDMFAAHAPPEKMRAQMVVINAKNGFAGAKSGTILLTKESGDAKHLEVRFEASRKLVSKELEVDTVLINKCGCLRIVSTEIIENGPRISVDLNDSSSCMCPNHVHGTWQVFVRAGFGWDGTEDDTLLMVGTPQEIKL